MLRDREGRCEVQYVPQCYYKMYGSTDNFKLPTELLFVELQWRLQFWRNNVILSVLVLVKAVGMKLLKVNSTGITVF